MTETMSTVSTVPTASSVLEDVSTTESPIYTLFDETKADRLTREHILQVAAGVLGCVHVEGFSSLADCDAVMEGLRNRPLGTYDEEIISPPIAKIGPAAYDFYGKHDLDERYWDIAEEARTIRSGLLRGGDPLDYAYDQVRRAWGDDVRPATSRGRDMFAGIIREMLNGAKLHFDEIVREFPGVLDETPASFVTFNWYLSAPEDGGETYVYRRRWAPKDEAHRDGYGYAEDFVADEPVAVIRPKAGDAAIFDSRNFHVVRPPGRGDRRISLSFFLGITGRGPLVTWS